MYPIISLLRRCAAHVVLVSPEFVTPLGLPLEKKASVVSFPDAKLIVAQHVPLFHLQSRGAPRQAALKLVKLENEIAEKIDALHRMYTLLLGPEDWSDGVHHSRMGIVIGVYALPKEGRLVSAEIVPSQPVAPRRKLPAGVIVERR